MEHFNIRNLTFCYNGSGGKKSLDDINLTIYRGEYVVLCGTSGSGKTTLLRHLKPVLAPFGKMSGTITFSGQETTKLSEFDQASKIGFVAQNPDEQIVTDKVWHELAFGLESIGCDQKTMRSRVAEMACYFGIQDWFHRDVATLSGGQKQLLNLASVMVMQPEVIILDEPTSQLDPVAASNFLNTIRKINTELGTTVIITEHRLEDILPYADRSVVMDDGKIIANDAPKNIGKMLFENHHPMFEAMPTPVRVFYETRAKGECPLTVRDGRTMLSKALNNDIKHTELKEKSDNEISEIAVNLKEIWFRYEKDSPDILRGLCAEIKRGETFAIVGANGAGKSTFLKTVCGIAKSYRGKIKIFNKPLNKYKYNELFDGCLAMLPQDSKSLFVKKTVIEDLEEMTADSEKLQSVAALCGIEKLLNSHPFDLSGGEIQRAALCKVLLTEPKILLLDEPTKGMDNFFKKSFAKILDDLKSQSVTVIMVSHDVEFCARYADRVGMFFDGQILTVDTSERFFGENSFYTTAANRMSRHIFKNAVTDNDVIELFRKNTEGAK